MFKVWKRIEQLNVLPVMFVMHFSNEFIVVGSVDDGKETISLTMYRSCTWIIVYECKFTERFTCFHYFYFCHPLGIFVYLKLFEFIKFIFCHVHMLINIIVINIRYTLFWLKRAFLILHFTFFDKVISLLGFQFLFNDIIIFHMCMFNLF